MNRRNKSLGWVFVLVAALLLTVAPFLSSFGSVAFAQTDAKAVTNDQLMPVVGGALVEAGQAQWTEASKDLKEFRTLWEAAKTNGGDSAHIATVDQALTDAEQTLASGGGESAKAALSVLARSVNEYVTAAEGDKPAPAGAKAAENCFPWRRAVWRPCKRRLGCRPGGLRPNRQSLVSGRNTDSFGQFSGIQFARN